MKTKIIIFKTCHIAVLLMFFLPFMPFVCGFGPSAEQLAEQARLDSLKMDSILQDSIAKIANLTSEKNISDSTPKNDTTIIQDSSYYTSTKLEEIKTGSIVKIDTLSSTTISKTTENKFLNRLGDIVGSLFLTKNGNLTGIGIVLFGFEDYLKTYGTTNAFLLLIVSCIMVFRKKWRFLKSILLIDIFGLIFLLFSEANLWGYWVCMFSWIGLLVVDFIVIKKSNS